MLNELYVCLTYLKQLEYFGTLYTIKVILREVNPSECY